MKEILQRTSLFIILIIAVGVLAACDDTAQTRKPRHSGMPGEVIVVMNDTDWRGAPGDSLRARMQTMYPGLPQIEPSFKLIHFNQTEMSSMLRHHRNIIEVHLGPSAQGKNTVTLTNDKWASNQLVFNAYASTHEDWYNLLNNQFPQVMDRINRKEIDRLQRFYRTNSNHVVIADIQAKFGVNLPLPTDCEMAISDKDFAWVKRERVRYLGNDLHDITQGFLFYQYPYTGDSAFTQEAILAVRDSVTKEYVPGPTKNSYMTTEYILPPTSEAITLDGRYAVITRGLWRTENHFMGGPFVSVTTTNPAGDKIVSMSGFVFAPKFDKREYIREIEAILLDAKFPEKETIAEDRNRP